MKGEKTGSRPDVSTIFLITPDHRLPAPVDALPCQCWTSFHLAECALHHPLCGFYHTSQSGTFQYQLWTSFGKSKNSNSALPDHELSMSSWLPKSHLLGAFNLPLMRITMWTVIGANLTLNFPIQTFSTSTLDIYEFGPSSSTTSSSNFYAVLVRICVLNMV